MSATKNKSTPLLSIVVPVYNVALYLEECLDSLLRQGLEPNEYEVIMVNDGATDGSNLIAEKWARRHQNFRLINQKNGGLSAARNIGIKHAKGKYLTFCDSDDIIPDNSYKERLDIIEETGSDFITGAVYRFLVHTENARQWRVDVLMSDVRKTTLSKNPEFLSDAAPWNKIYNRKFFMNSGVLFPTGRIYEDIATTPILYGKARSFDVYSKPAYYWRITKGSISNAKSLKHHEDRLWGIRQSLEYLRKQQVDSAIINEFDFFIIDYNLRWILLDLFNYDRPTRYAIYKKIRPLLREVDDKTLRRVYYPLNKWVKLIKDGHFDDVDTHLSKEQHIVNEVKKDESPLASVAFLKRFLSIKYRRFRLSIRRTKDKIKRRSTKFFIYFVLRPLFTRLPIRHHHAVFSSYWGREFSLSDAPPSICVELAKNKRFTCIVFANKESYKKIRENVKSLTNNAENVKVIQINSVRYFYYIWTAKYLFNDVNFQLGIHTPDGYKYANKRKDQVEVQTTHGIPLKKLGVDSELAIPSSERKPFLAKTKRYDYIVASSQKVAEVLRGAFKTNAKVLKTGLPQNDFLFRTYDDKHRRQIKEKYGIDKNKKIVLYSPTYRYDKNYAFRYLMDMDLLHKSLGDEYQLIVKLHPFNHTNVSLIDFNNLTDLEDNSSSFIKIFGEIRLPKNPHLPLSAPYADRWEIRKKHADINELLLVADVLVLDYSSIMFNASHLNVPKIFFTPDSEFYNGTRGMYFDIDQIAPGAVVKNSEELIDAIKLGSDKEKWNKKYGAKIAKFQKDFLVWEKGEASRKILESIGITRK